MKPNRVGRKSAGKPAKTQVRDNTENSPGANPAASPDEAAATFVRTLDWLRREIGKATNLPAYKMIARLRELLFRQEALSREVEKYLSAEDRLSEPEKLCRKVAALPPKAQATAIAMVRTLYDQAKAKSKGNATVQPCPVLSVELHVSANN